MKKILSICLLLILSTIMLSACKVDTPTQSTSVSESDVALLSIFTYDGKSETKAGLMNLGHSFLSFENISENEIKVGDATLISGETISIGTWCIKSHFGVWYNVESNYIKDTNKYDGRISVTAGVDLEDLDIINDFISTHDYWSPINNCSNFALNLWNSVAESNEELVKPFIYSPGKIARALKNFEGYEINREINTTNQFYYFENGTAKYYKLDV